MGRQNIARSLCARKNQFQRRPQGSALCALSTPGDPLMSVRHWHAVLLTLVVLCGLGGCSGNYKFNDNDYRPLGDPQAVNRGK
jgi:hypothetical protein